MITIAFPFKAFFGPFYSTQVLYFLLLFFTHFLTWHVENKLSKIDLEYTVFNKFMLFQVQFAKDTNLAEGNELRLSKIRRDHLKI